MGKLTQCIGIYVILHRLKTVQITNDNMLDDTDNKMFQVDILQIVI